MAEANKTVWAHFPETAMWRLIRTIDTAVVEPQNEFTEARAPIVPDDSGLQVPVKHDPAKHLRGRNMMRNMLEKVSGIILLIVCANFSLTMSFNLLFIINYFLQMTRLLFRILV